MYFIVTHMSTVWQSLRYVESANIQQIDTPLMLHSPEIWGTQLRPDNAQRRVITTNSMVSQLNP